MPELSSNHTSVFPCERILSNQAREAFGHIRHRGSGHLSTEEAWQGKCAAVDSSCWPYSNHESHDHNNNSGRPKPDFKKQPCLFDASIERKLLCLALWSAGFQVFLVVAFR